jgi:hypothetical protein
VPAAPRAVRATAPVMLMASPDRRRRLADGVLVEASIRARLLGLRLLKIDATVVLVPADITAPTRAAQAPPERRRPQRSGAAGHGLAEAVRSINEGAELLAEARRNGA